MKLKKLLVFGIVLSLLMFSGCSEDIGDYHYNGEKKYSGSSETLNLSVNYEQKLCNNTGAAITCDNENIYVIGSENNADSYYLKVIDFSNNNSRQVNPDIDYWSISDSAVTGDDLYVIYQNHMYENHLSRIDKYGSVINDCVLDDGMVQEISISEKFCYCYSVDELYDKSLNFTLDIFDKSLQKVNTVNLNELLKIQDNEGIISVVCDSDDSLYFGIALFDDEKSSINNLKIVKLSESFQELYHISELSGMAGDSYKLCVGADGILCVGSYDDENSLIYENIYSTSDGSLLSMYEKQMEADEWLPGKTGDIRYRVDNKWYTYNLKDGTSYDLYNLENGAENCERVLFDDGYSAVLLYRERRTSFLKISVYTDCGDLIQEKNIETDFDFIPEISGVCICDNRLYAVCELNLSDISDKIFVYNLKSESAEWYDVNDIDNAIYKITDAETDGNSVFFLSQYQNTEFNTLYTGIIRCSSDNILNVLDFPERNSDEYWDELVKDANGNIFLYTTYPDTKFKNISNGETVIGFEEKFSENSSLYTVEGTSIYGYDMLKKTVCSKPFNLLLKSCVVSDNNIIVCLANDFSDMKNILLFINESNESSRNIIKVLCPDIKNSDISKAVEKFNLSHDGDYIELYEICDNSTSDFMTGFENIDVVISTSSAWLSQYALNGTLCDLKEYICKDTNIKADDFIVPDFNGDNVFYIYPEFSLSVYICDKIQTDVRQLKNIAELVDVMDKKNIQVIEKDKETEFFINIIEDNINKLIDFQSRSCDFNCDLFYELINLIDKQKTIEYSNDNITIDQVDIYNPDMFEEIKNKSYMIYFFNEDNSDALISPEYYIALCDKSDNKEVAWEFIRSTLDEDYQNNTRVLPIRKSAYNEVWKKTEVLNEFTDVIFDAKIKYSLDPKLLSLISEQIEMYLNNTISKEELTDSLNTKVSLYLNEKN